MSNDTMYVGIDCSMNSTGLCININQKHYKLIQIVSGEAKEKHRVPGTEYTTYERLFSAEKTDEDICKHISAEKLADAIKAVVVTYMTRYNISKDNVYVGIEGTSFGSRGKSSRLVDMVIFSSIVKRKMLTMFHRTRVRSWAPGSIKKSFTGSGRANKELMHEEYVKRFGDPNVPKGAKFDDMVDAYAITMINSDKCQHGHLSW